MKSALACLTPARLMFATYENNCTASATHLLSVLAGSSSTHDFQMKYVHNNNNKKQKKGLCDCTAMDMPCSFGLSCT